MKILALFITLSLSFSCNESDKIKSLKTTSEFTLNVDNLDINAVGYKHFEEDMDVGVNSMFVFNNTIYLPDVFHKNIKAFNIETKRLKVSEELTAWITDIMIYNQKVLVVSDYNGLSLLDLDLNINEKSIQLPKGYKYFIKYDEEFFIVNYSVVKRSEGRVFYECYKLDSLLTHKIDKVNLASEVLPDRVCFFDNEKQIEEKLYLEVGNSFYEIPHSLKRIKEYDAFNIFVEDKQITYYYIDEKELEIKVFTY